LVPGLGNLTMDIFELAFETYSDFTFPAAFNVKPANYPVPANPSDPKVSSFQVIPNPAVLGNYVTFTFTVSASSGILADSVSLSPSYYSNYGQYVPFSCSGGFANGNSTVQKYQYGPCMIPSTNANVNGRPGQATIVAFSNTGGVTIAQDAFNVTSNFPSLVISNFACSPYDVPVGGILACLFDISGPPSIFTFGSQSLSVSPYLQVKEENCPDCYAEVYPTGGGLTTYNATFYSYAYVFTIPSYYYLVPGLGNLTMDIYELAFYTYSDFTFPAAFNLTSS